MVRGMNTACQERGRAAMRRIPRLSPGRTGVDAQTGGVDLRGGLKTARSTGSLDAAIRHMRETEEAIRDARPIEQIREYRKQATEALNRTQAELAGGTVTETIDSAAASAKAAPDRVAGTADEAPAAYQGMVSEYYKAISSAPH